MNETLTPIAAADIMADGTAQLITDAWPDIAPSPGALWRWLHCDRTGPGFGRWSREKLSAAARSGLLQAETRPRCDVVDGGLVLALRAMNLNPGQAAEDMVSLRLWVTPTLIVSTRFRRMFLIEELLAEMQSGHAPLTSAAFVARLADKITTRIEAESAESEEAIDTIEEELLDARGTGSAPVRWASPVSPGPLSNCAAIPPHSARP